MREIRFSSSSKVYFRDVLLKLIRSCLLYTSDAADERSSVDLGGRRIIKKKNNEDIEWIRDYETIENRAVR